MIKRCPSYPGYSISHDGVVYTHYIQTTKLVKDGKGGCRVIIDYGQKKEMKRGLSNKGYVNVALRLNHKCKSRRVHSLLLDAFVGPRPKQMVARHLDGNKLNNKLSNLKYGTRKENGQDMIKHGTSPRGERGGNSKLNNSNVKGILRCLAKGWALRKTAEMFDVSISCIYDIKRGVSWKNIQRHNIK